MAQRTGGGTGVREWLKVRTGGGTAGLLGSSHVMLGREYDMYRYVSTEYHMYGYISVPSTMNS